MAKYSKAPKSSVIYYDIPSVENVFLYTEGGLHPIQIGDSLQGGQFKIVNKLGYGAYSTVWLAMDSSQNRLVALKVLRGDVSLVGTEAKLAGILAAHQDRHLLALPEQSFKVEGPNGIHDVVVLPIAGPTLSQYMEGLEEHRLPVNIRNRAIQEIVRGLACLHQAGFGHGDLHTSNILLRLPDSYLKNQEDLLACIGSPVSEPVMRMDGKPITEHAPELVFLPAKFSFPGHFDGSIVIADFGSTFKTSDDEGNARFSVYAPTAAPERLLGKKIGLPSDIWSLACAIFQLISGKELFESNRNTSQMVLFEIMEVLGKPSEDWWLRWEKVAADLAITRRDAADCNNGPEKLDEMIDDLDDLTTDKELLKDMLKRMLTLEPEERLTIKEVQEHPWFCSL
ncbi:kinase-like domain-containing protein [Tricladium varicosporioides]|nr:kinase-like domain-containing protein [Hymenoscyphus varicosporioides]